ncbi:hypothetical protein C4D60_Mb08t28350 [Musa balbisiana]|uniref:Uncharacterized protein n=1 Tax=Musa balbisiana TaxID=52838 RepID=A0A4S8K783_MUSBA|nr:hypothetical protein C4D60_Mb08t28350 [Musa balbisiana]
MTRGEEDQTSRFLNELCSILFAVLRSPQLAIRSSSAPSHGVGRIGTEEMPYRSPLPTPRRRRRLPQASPAAVASLMLGVSIALMLGGSVTFVLGFMLMPWVIGMLTMLYLAGIVMTVSELGRAILFPSTTKEVKGRYENQWKRKLIWCLIATTVVLREV